jgi:hypothetical protein
VHGHCHQKAIMGMQYEMDVLRRLAPRWICSTAAAASWPGASVSKSTNTDVSMKVFAHELQRHVATTPMNTILITDGFSCKTQIQPAMGREALHIAQVMKMAVDRREQNDRGQLELCRNDGNKREWITGIGLLAWKAARACKKPPAVRFYGN